MIHNTRIEVDFFFVKSKNTTSISTEFGFTSFSILSRFKLDKHFLSIGVNNKKKISTIFQEISCYDEKKNMCNQIIDSKLDSARTIVKYKIHVMSENQTHVFFTPGWISSFFGLIAKLGLFFIALLYFFLYFYSFSVISYCCLFAFDVRGHVYFIRKFFDGYFKP
jgi:hypothetical protein